MSDITELAPLFAEDVNTIHRRLLGDLNAGLEPTDPQWLDTTPGGWASDLLRACAMEFERVWDAVSQELPAAGMLAFAWGEYLDDQASGYGIERKDAAYASGTVRFTGPVGAVLGSGVEVAVPAGVETDPDAEPIVFRTTTSGTVPVGGTLDLPVVADDAGAAGNVGADAVTLLYSPVDVAIASVTNPEAIGGGADVESDEQLRDRLLQYIGAPLGSGTVADLTRWSLAYPGVEHVTVQPLFAGAGTARVVITGGDNQPVGQATIEGLQDRLDRSSAVASVTEDVTLAGSGGTIEVSSTAGWDDSGRVVGGGTVLGYTGRTATTLTGVSGGDGITLTAGSLIRQSGRGHGLAPVSAVVVVATASTVSVDVVAQIDPAPGYSVDGSGGTISLGGDLATAVAAYIDALGPGEDVIRGRVATALFAVRGVHDVVSVSLNGVTANFSVAPLQVAESGALAFA